MEKAFWELGRGMTNFLVRWPQHRFQAYTFKIGHNKQSCHSNRKQNHCEHHFAWCNCANSADANMNPQQDDTMLHLFPTKTVIILWLNQWYRSARKVFQERQRHPHPTLKHRKKRMSGFHKSNSSVQANVIVSFTRQLHPSHYCVNQNNKAGL